MSKWIDYDAIDYKHYQLHDKSEEFLNGVVYMAQRIEEAPSIDICFCRECKWFDSKGHCMRLTAEFGIYEDVGTDDFCSRGERKSDE